MKASRLACLVIGFLLNATWAQRPVAPTAATLQFLEDHPSTHASVAGERLAALYGGPFYTRDVATATATVVSDFLTAHGDALGVENLAWSCDSPIAIRGGKYEVSTCTQMIEGLPVHGSVMKIPVHVGAQEKRIAHVGMRLFPTPQTQLPADVLTGDQAKNNVAATPTYQHLTGYTTPEKVMFEDAFGELHRVWRFEGYDPNEIYRFFVDTSRGDLLTSYSLFEFESVSGVARGAGTPPPAADNPPEELELPGLRVRLRDSSGCAGPVQDETYAGTDDPGDGPVGAYTVSGSLPGHVTAELVGEWVTVLDCSDKIFCAPEQECDLTTLNGLTTGVSVCESVSTDDPLDLALTPSTTEFNVSQVNAFVYVQESHDWFAGLLDPPSPVIDVNIPAVVNIDFVNGNAGFSPVPLALLFSQSGPCRDGGICINPGSTTCNTHASPMVISHEYGHFIRNRVVGPYLLDPAFNEGIADVVSTYMWDIPEHGLGLRQDTPSWDRNVDTPDVRLEDGSTIPTWCSFYCFDWFDPGCPPHCRGLAISGAFWDLRTALLECIGGSNHSYSCSTDADCPGGVCSDHVAEELFADFMFITQGRMDFNAVAEVLIADDDDGDLTTPTPHETAIRDSFITLHGWPDPTDSGAMVNVDWRGPDEVGLFPEEGVDYTVHSDVHPPNVTLKTVAAGGRPVRRWIIGRDGHPLGTVRAVWDNPGENVTVQIGHPTEQAFRVGSVNIVEIPRQTSSTWSNVELFVDASVNGRVQCYAADSGAGGLVSGQVSGEVVRLFGNGIGTEASGVGSLVTGIMHAGRLGSVASGSELRPSVVTNQLEIGGLLNGDLFVFDVIASRGRPATDGGIHVEGTGTSSGNITVELLWAGEIFIDDDYAGTMTIQEMRAVAEPPIDPALRFGSLSGTAEIG